MPELLIIEMSQDNIVWTRICVLKFTTCLYVPPSMFWDKIVCKIFALKGVRCKNHELGQDKTLLNHLTHDIFIRQKRINGTFIWREPFWKQKRWEVSSCLKYVFEIFSACSKILWTAILWDQILEVI